jgi:hypothetical protein
MTKLSNPINFTAEFGIDDGELSRLGFVDIILNADTNLFIDPLLLSESRHDEISCGSSERYTKHFEKIVKLLSVVKTMDSTDVAFRSATKLFQFHEISWTCLGYGGAVGGSGFGKELISATLDTAKQIVDLGVTDVDLFMALALFEEGIGPDRISDMTTNIILLDLIKFNERLIVELKITTEEYVIGGIKYQLITNPYVKKKVPVLLVPSDIVRALPIASDWSDISRVVRENEELRDRVNNSVGEIWATMDRKAKDSLKRSALKSKESFASVLEMLKSSAGTSYDMKNDPNGEVFWGKVAATIATEYPFDLCSFKQRKLTANEVHEIVGRIIKQFQFLIEERDLWRELWNETKTKNRKEKAAQRLLFAVADSYCKANDLDLTPEAETGNGPVDFKVSAGANSKVIVEIKLSTNSSTVHGYEKQLEIYRNAERTDKAYFLLIDVGSMGKKDERVIELKNKQIADGYTASEVIIIDGLPRDSASKRV